MLFFKIFQILKWTQGRLPSVGVFLYAKHKKWRNKKMNDLEQPMNQREQIYCSALLRNQMRLWDIPKKVRRGAHCRTFYVIACRYTRDSGAGISRFDEDFDFLHKELWYVENAEQYEYLSRAYDYMTDTGRMLYGLNCLPDKPPYWNNPRARIALKRLKHSTVPKKLGLSARQFERLSLNTEFQKEFLEKAIEIAQKYLAQEND